MKGINLKYYVVTIMIGFILMLMQMMVFAQDTTLVTTTTTTTNPETLWYMQPWVWIAGGAALLLILIAMFSGKRKDRAKSRTDRVIITKTIRTETDADD